jgi:hypothetical protein
MEFVSCQTSSAKNFEVARRFLENVCIPGVSMYLFSIYLFVICFMMLSVE